MSVDWNALEETALQGVLQDLKDFAQEHGEEEFYGVIFWCESVEIFVYMPTEDLLRAEAAGIHKQNLEANYQVEKSVEDIMAEIRWGATQYCVPDHISWDPYEVQISSVTEEDEQVEGFAERYLELLCHVALRAEASGAFNAFQRTADFRVFCKSSDHDDETCEQVLQQVRQSLSR